MVLCLLGVSGIALSKESSNESIDLEASSQLTGIGVCFCVAWAYATCNVISRKLKDIHFSVICFYHPIIGVTIGASFMLGAYFIGGVVPTVHSWDLYGWVLLGCMCDFIVFNS